VGTGEAITKLLEDGFEPRRTIILSHGNDEEEVFARRGQGHIAPFLEKRYGKDGLLMVIDEGSGTDDNVSGQCAGENRSCVVTDVESSGLAELSRFPPWARRVTWTLS
jgi:acetylornithine deacetylase/succinyl-diaminopimelate desuccinylase-like protein